MDPSLPLAVGLVATGGAVGSALRYLVAVGITNSGRPSWLATLGVNVVGAFLLGGLVAAAPPRRAVLLLGTGLLGGFTTFSTLTADVVGLGVGDWRGITLAGVSIVCGVLAFSAGAALLRGA